MYVPPVFLEKSAETIEGKGIVKYSWVKEREERATCEAAKDPPLADRAAKCVPFEWLKPKQ